MRSGGWLLGHFLLTPTPGQPVSPDRLLVAVAIADQVGVALAADESPDGSLASARLGPGAIARRPIEMTGDHRLPDAGVMPSSPGGHLDIDISGDRVRSRR